jgi:hypothetical protein
VECPQRGNIRLFRDANFRAESPQPFRYAEADGAVAGEGAEGNPIEIMDLSFAAQFSALKYLIENRGNLPLKVIELPEEVSEKIAGERLRK